MSPQEIELAYEGYLRRKETEANLIQIAIKKNLEGTTELIRLTADKGYIVGNDFERENTFKKLGIM